MEGRSSAPASVGAGENVRPASGVQHDLFGADPVPELATPAYVPPPETIGRFLVRCADA